MRDRRRNTGTREERDYEASPLVGRAWVALWLSLVLGGSALAISAREAGPLPGDLLLTRLLEPAGSETIVGSSFVRFGDAAWWLVPLAIVLTALLKRRWSDALFLFVAGLTGGLLGDLLIKDLVERPRPSETVGAAEGYSFPSGTVFLVTATLGAACYLVWRSRPRRIVAAGAFGASLLLAFLVGLSRVYSGEHWPTDVLGGWVLGGAWAILLVAVYRRWGSGRLGEEESQRGDKVDADEHRAL